MESDFFLCLNVNDNIVYETLAKISILHINLANEILFDCNKDITKQIF